MDEIEGRGQRRGARVQRVRVDSLLGAGIKEIRDGGFLNLYSGLGGSSKISHMEFFPVEEDHKLVFSKFFRNIFLFFAPSGAASALDTRFPASGSVS